MESKEERENLNEIRRVYTEDEYHSLNKTFLELTNRYQTAVKKNKNYRKAIRQLQGSYNGNRVLNSKLYNELKDARILMGEFRKQLNEQNNEIKRVMNLKYKKWWHLW